MIELTATDSLYFPKKTEHIKVYGAGELGAVVSQTFNTISSVDKGVAVPLSTRLNDFFNWVNSPQRTDNPGLRSINGGTHLKVKDFFDQYNTVLTEWVTLVDLQDDYDNRTPDDPERQKIKEGFVRANQTLTRELYYLHTLEKNDPRRESAEFFFDVVDAMGRSGFKGFTELQSFFNGARAQAGIMRALHNAGYFIMQPDPESDEELKWDLMGIDFMALDPNGKLRMIDTKGRYRDREESKDEKVKISRQGKVYISGEADIKTDVEYDIDPHLSEKYKKLIPGIAAFVSNIEPSVREKYKKSIDSFVGKVAQDRTHTYTYATHEKILIPTDGKYLGRLGTIVEPELNTKVVNLINYQIPYAYSSRK